MTYFLRERIKPKKRKKQEKKNLTKTKKTISVKSAKM